MPHLQSLWSEVQEKRGNEVVFLCVNLQDEEKVIRDWWEEDGFTLQPVQQEGSVVSKAFGVKYYPTNFIINPEGKVVYRRVGWQEGEIREALGLTK